jgi:DNA-binding SARP family transcriptional activator
MGETDPLEFGLLGPLEVRRGAEVLTPSAAKQRALLALLLLNANSVVSTDRLVDELWGEKAPATAPSALQVHVSQLRRVLEPRRAQRDAHGVVVTRPPGYLVQIAPEQLDLHRFERLVGDGAQALADGRASAASATLREALALWRGPALADLMYESFAQAPASRLEELRLAALEKRLEADLASGHHAELVGELQELSTEHPLREGFAGQLMLALYRCRRQAEALETYQRARRHMVEDLGIEPSPALQRLEHDILVQNPALDFDAPRVSAVAPRRTVMVVLTDNESDAELLAIAQQLARGRVPHEVLVVHLLDPAESDRLEDVTQALTERRSALEAGDVTARIAAFTSAAPAQDLIRLTSRSEVDLLLTSAPADLARDGVIAGTLDALLREVLCDAVFLVPNASRVEDRAPIHVPFGASEHDWAALELGAWLAGAAERPLHLLGTTATGDAERRDASRLLADAGLLVQRASGVAPVPRLVAPGHQGILDAAADRGPLVIGLTEHWSDEGLGATRWAIVKTASVPVLFVRRGLRPGGLAPDVSATRYGWSVTAGA